MKGANVYVLIFCAASLCTACLTAGDAGDGQQAVPSSGSELENATVSRQASVWTKLPQLPAARLAPGAAVVGGRLYLIGGCLVRGNEVAALSTVESFDPVRKVWERKAPMPTARSMFGIAVADERIYVVGGTTSDSTSSIGAVEIYDPATDTWKTGASMPTARCQTALVFIGGKLYAIGGNAGNEYRLEAYDIAADAWTELPQMPAPQRAAGAVALGNSILVFGGVKPDGWAVKSDLAVYSPETGVWTALPSAPGARTDFACVERNGKLIVVGGFRNGALSTVEEYDPVLRAWSALERLPLPLQFPAAAVLDGRIVVAGGTSRLPDASADVLISSGQLLRADDGATGVRDSHAVSQPVPFAGWQKDPKYGQWGVTFSPDGTYVCFNQHRGNNPIVFLASHFQDGRWTDPKTVKLWGTGGEDRIQKANPYIQPDGRRLFFNARNAPGGSSGRDSDIWFMEKTDDGWSAPALLDAPVNTRKDEYMNCVTSDGTIYFNVWETAGSDKSDIFRSKPVNGAYSPPERLPKEINSEYDDSEACVSPDGSRMVFVSQRPDGLGEWDLYASRLERGRWTPARNLGKNVNSPSREARPTFSPDGKYLFFGSERNGEMDIYRVDARVLEIVLE